MATSVKPKTRRLPAVLPQEEDCALFDREARRIVDLSGEQFLAKWDAGEYRDLDDTPEGRKIGYLILLIPFGRRLS